MVPQISLKRTLPSSFKDESMRKKKKKRGFVPMQPEPGPSKTITPVKVSKPISDIQQQRRELPVFSARKRLLKKLRSLDNAIIIGETGSGKTTQIPQPRRVAAITIAQRVAAEQSSEVGSVVGYCVRFEDMTSADTRIKYMTDGMLLREAILDPLLKRYSVVVLDEAHERTIHTDVLFGVVKAAQRRRKKKNKPLLRIIIMSATMDVDQFSEYFCKAPVIYLEGRQFPVELMYAQQPQTDYLFSILITIFQIHKKAPPRDDILVFLTGQEEIEAMVKNIKDIANDLPGGLPRLFVFPLYAAQPQIQQLKVFKTTPKDARKIIIATNVAETSITIHGIKYVIDSGMVKAKVYNSHNGLDLLKECRVSQAQAWQRTGRAGRQRAGFCYRMYTEKQFNDFASHTVPELQRCNMGSVVLQLVALGIKNIEQFDFMDKPSPAALESAFEELHWLGALQNGSNSKLTDLGKQMAAFPLEPRLSKVLISAKEHHCLDEVLTVVSLLSVESILSTPHSKRDQVKAVREKFISSEGDHVTLLNVFKAYKSVKGNKHWCSENFVHSRHVKTALSVKQQLQDICVRLNLPITSCGKDTSILRKCLCSGFFMNTAELQEDGKYSTMSTYKGKKTVHIHPSSALFRCKPACVLYTELVMTSKCYMRNVCVVDSDWLFEMIPGFFKQRIKGK